MIVHEIFHVPYEALIYRGVFGGTGSVITVPEYEDSTAISVSPYPGVPLPSLTLKIQPTADGYVISRVNCRGCLSSTFSHAVVIL